MNNSFSTYLWNESEKGDGNKNVELRNNWFLYCFAIIIGTYKAKQQFQQVQSLMTLYEQGWDLLLHGRARACQEQGPGSLSSTTTQLPEAVQAEVTPYPGCAF